MRRRNSYSNGKSAWFLINNQPRGWKLGTKITTFSLLSCGVLVFPARWGCLRCWEARNFGSTFVVIWLCSLVKSPFFTSREKIKIIPLGQPQHNLWSPASTPWGTELFGKVRLLALWESEKFWQHFCCNLVCSLVRSPFLPPKRKSRLFHLWANPKKNSSTPASMPWETGLSGKVKVLALRESKKFWQHFWCNLVLLPSQESFFTSKEKIKIIPPMGMVDPQCPSPMTPSDLLKG